MKEETKAKKTDVGYSKAQAGNSCSACMNFVLPNVCNLVEGTINPQATCQLFTPATGVVEEEESLDVEAMVNKMFGGIQ